MVFPSHTPTQFAKNTFLTDGGLETTLVYHEGIDLPHFAAFVLVDDSAGKETLVGYYRRYADIACKSGHGFIFESPTWRASADWGDRLGYSARDLDSINRASVEILAGLRYEYRPRLAASAISGCIGPRGDGYVTGETMSPDEAERYHLVQVTTFACTEAELVTAITMTYPDEAIGIARAAARCYVPAVISFTVETDGRLPSGHTLGDAIQQVDKATDGYPAFYMINCAHPTHFAATITGDHSWKNRIGGIRANASTRSHAELDEAEELDAGDPVDLAERYRELRRELPNLTVVGGCCGTDHRHIEQIAAACA